MHTRMRMIAAGAAVALLTGTAGAAVAATSGTASPAASTSSPAPKPSPSGTGNGCTSGSQQEWLARLAASFHVTVPSLEAALGDAKQTIGRLGVAPTDPAVVAVVVHDLGISSDQAKQLLTEVFGNGPNPGKSGSGTGDQGKGGSGKGGKGGPGTTPPPGTPDPQISHALAGILHVSAARAAQVLEQLDRIAWPSRSIPTDNPQFRALAASLHLTPQQLADALYQMKQALSASRPSPSSTSSPSSKPPAPNKC